MKKLRVFILLLAAAVFGSGASVINSYRFAAPAGGTPALIASVATAGTGPGVTSGNINTTGANFIAIAVSWYNGTTPNGTLSDSNGNTWTALTTRSNASGQISARVFYCYNPTVGSGHNFSYAGTSVHPGIAVMAFSNIASSPFDVENGSDTVGTSLATGSITASQANAVLITSVGFELNGGTASISSPGSFTGLIQVPGGTGVNEGVAMAYRIDTAATATNVTWAISGTTKIAAAVTAFKY